MNVDTKRKLNSMNMNDVVESIEIQENNPVLYLQMSFEERINAIVDDIYQRRHNDKILRRISQAKLRYPSASITELDYKSRNIDKSFIMDMASMRFINTATNIIIQGFTGSGKTYLSCAIAKEACKQDIRTFTIRLPEMLQKRAEEKILHRENKYLNKLASYNLLVIDEWLIFNLTDDDIRFIYELIEARYSKYSTIFVGQYSTKEWHAKLGGGVHADSIMDRVIHNSITIESNAINMRELLDSKKYNK